MAIIAGGQTKDAIRWRQIVGSEFEPSALPDIERHPEIRLKQHEPKTNEALEACIQLAREDVDFRGKI
jgi:hypothetical protein